jgi:di/tricarboxylate transporter
MDPAIVSLVILGAAVVLFVWNRLPVGVVALLTALSLYATGVVSAEAAVAGFGDPVVIFIASLFVVSEGIDATGVTAWAGQALMKRAGTGRTRLVVVVMLLSALLTALITPNGAVAALLPMVVVIAARVALPPARLLLPLAFAAHAGSLLVLTGSPLNVIVSEAARDAGAPGFGFFSFGLVGLPLLVGNVAVVVLFGHRLLPHRMSRSVPPDFGRHAQTLAGHYGFPDGLSRLRVRPGSPLLGVPPAELDLSAYPGLTLLGVQAGPYPGPARHPVQPDDVLVISGDADTIDRLAREQGLDVAKQPVDGSLLTREAGVVEVVVPPRSPLVGETVFPGMLRGPDLVILAVQRVGKDRGARPTELAAGDTLLVRGAWPAIEGLADDRDVLIVDSPDLVRRHAVPLGPGAGRATAILAGMVIMLALGPVPPAIAALLAAVAMVTFRVVSPPQAYRAVSWQIVVLIGGLIPLTAAIQDTGAADRIADLLIGAVGTNRPYLLMLALFLVTVTLGQVVSNTATVLIVLPIAVSAAVEAGVSVQPIAMLIAVAGSASFLTPIATASNLMVMTPGGYRFGDYWKLGLPLIAVWLAIALLVIPLVWRF